MVARVLTAAVGIPILIWFLFWNEGVPYMAAVALLGLLGLGEFYRGCATQGIRTVWWVGYPATALLLVGALPWGEVRIGPYLEALLTGLIAAGLIGEMLREDRAPVASLGATLLGVVYAGWLFHYLILLRIQGPYMRSLTVSISGTGAFVRAGPEEAGVYLVLLVFFATWACDTAAFFVGRSLGRRRLAPRLSPGKTVEGAVGGLLASVLVTAFLGTGGGLSLAAALVLGALIGVLGQAGDLCESAIKRELGLKDFGSILPGHGGVLDRFDSLLLTAPAVYYLVRFWPA